MKNTIALSSAILVLAAHAGPAFAESHATFEMPAECQPTQSMGEMDHSAMGHGSADAAEGMAMSHDPSSDGMSDHTSENMRRMMITMPAMEMGMQMDDADVAFACAMIAHHQGAIDMAQVLLEFGDDPQMIQLAGEIIAAQVGEIDRMAMWLTENAQ